MPTTTHKFNLNDPMRVRLTDFGRKILASYCEESPLPRQWIFRRLTAANSLTLPAWHIMHIFGHAMEFGYSEPFGMEVEFITDTAAAAVPIPPLTLQLEIKDDSPAWVNAMLNELLTNTVPSYLERIRSEVDALEREREIYSWYTAFDEIFQPEGTYTATNVPSGETWVVIGVDRTRKKICCAGWPATIASFSDMRDWKFRAKITCAEMQYRRQTFGDGWE